MKQFELLRHRSIAELRGRSRLGIDADTLTRAARILDDVDRNGESAVRRWSEQLGDRTPDSPLIIDADVCRQALESLPDGELEALKRAHSRIESFAVAQRASLADLELDLPAGRAGHEITPIATAGCYAPGGRYPLPSSVLMTAVTARAAGVERVYVASPRPTAATLAAAALGRADAVLAVGGVQAIGALVNGIAGLDYCDVVVGPGNRWVTAAKQLVNGRVRIDMLAGPSELMVIADDSADPAWVAADLLAQAEHDPDAVPMLVTWCSKLPEAVERELERQLADLPTADIARRAMNNGGLLTVDDPEEAVAAADAMAPEHLQLSTRDPRDLLTRCRHYGAAFLGHHSAEVFGDYGAGPNHTLPTGGTARFSGGLWVGTFLRTRTWLDLDPSLPAFSRLVADTEVLADLEGLAGHRRAASIRRDRMKKFRSPW